MPPSGPWLFAGSVQVFTPLIPWRGWWQLWMFPFSPYSQRYHFLSSFWRLTNPDAHQVRSQGPHTKDSCPRAPPPHRFPICLWNPIFVLLQKWKPQRRCRIQVGEILNSSPCQLQTALHCLFLPVNLHSMGEGLYTALSLHPSDNKSGSFHQISWEYERRKQKQSS